MSGFGQGVVLRSATSSAASGPPTAPEPLVPGPAPPAHGFASVPPEQDPWASCLHAKGADPMKTSMDIMEPPVEDDPSDESCSEPAPGPPEFAASAVSWSAISVPPGVVGGPLDIGAELPPMVPLGSGAPAPVFRAPVRDVMVGCVLAGA